ncbi:MAG: NAD(P)/FAD-dependent oxidoreductase [Halioglobus sp.]
MSVKEVDVLIVGAGLSGIGAAAFLQERCPDKSYAIFEGREAIGGTWDLFRYPGIRSDSDMYTLGYGFKPWEGGKSLADGPSIRSYVCETAKERGIDKNIHFGHKVLSANWSKENSAWTVTFELANGDRAQCSARFLYMCSGYYDYEQGYRPDFTQEADFEGEIVHPQHWPEDLDYSDKNVVIVGSGATAVTLVPAMAAKAKSVTMLQRSPTWIVSKPGVDKFALAMRKIMPASWAYKFARWKNTQWQQRLYHLTRTRPELARKKLLKMIRKEVGPDYDVDTHLTPQYNPWDQRVCLVPDSDLFIALREGKAHIATDEIERFTRGGIALKSGRELPADVIVTATGLNLSRLGKVEFSVDGELVDFSKTWYYRGAMYSGVPNLVSTFGYINASWTLRADLIAGFVCRLINHMDSKQCESVTPTLRPEDENMEPRPWVDGFPAGYITRTQHLFPKQGPEAPWTNPQILGLEKPFFEEGNLDDGVLNYA